MRAVLVYIVCLPAGRCQWLLTVPKANPSRLPVVKAHRPRTAFRQRPPAPRRTEHPLVLGRFLIGSVLAFATGAIVVQLQSVDSAIKAAVWGLAITSLVWVGAALLWGSINPGNANEPALAPLLRDGANVVITVDGVVLGLIYAFVGDKVPATVVKIGSVALMAGVVFALTLYSLAAGNITTRAAVGFATALYSLAAWALAFGLECIVFALIFR